MTGIAELMAEARAAGIRFSVKDDGKVEMRAHQAPPLELVARLKAAKPALLVVLGAAPPIAEIPTEWQEGAAKLRGAECPACISVGRWKQLMDDTDLFLASEWASKAAALGWDTASLFMCHRTRPVERFDCRGVLWGIGGGKIIAITETVMMVFTAKTRSKLAHYRPRPCRGEPVVMAWELADKAAA